MSRDSIKVLYPPPSDEEIDTAGYAVEIDEDETAKSFISKKCLLPRKADSLPIDSNLVGTTQAMFFEHRYSTTSKVTAPYCLKPYDWEKDGITYRSMYLIYMSCDSEYEAAIKLLGSYPHWQKLAKAPWFRKHLDKWNDELVLREQALAKSELVALTQRGNVTAARTLLNTKKVVGRKKSEGGRQADTNNLDDIDAMIDRASISTQSIQ